ncbi:hypothetical protein [Nocardiopsis sp. NRRL B-16309]|uniref:hypothetical protein n=1 Tax=Nocardiopsis sp. NRRL B-16309 TaxID=1519494 RepID=UPI0012E266E0|nr:hypothetical protein [Nocardiopsis sp. NRRL B-16309]
MSGEATLNEPHTPDTSNNINGTIEGASVQAHTIQSIHFHNTTKREEGNPFLIEVQRKYGFVNNSVDISLKSRLGTPVYIQSLKPRIISRHTEHPAEGCAPHFYSYTHLLFEVQLDPGKEKFIPTENVLIPIEVENETATRLQLDTLRPPIGHAVEWEIHVDWFFHGMPGTTRITNEGRTFVSTPLDHDCSMCPPF